MTLSRWGEGFIDQIAPAPPAPDPLSKQECIAHIINWSHWQRSIKHPAPSINAYAVQPWFSPERNAELIENQDDREPPDPDLAERTEAILCAMPESQAKILQLKWHACLPWEDIAKIMRLGSVRTANNHKNTALRRYGEMYVKEHL